MAKKAPVVIEVLNKVTAVSVEKHTGKNWDQWIKILNDQGAKNLSHKEIVALLGKKAFKMKEWWRQIVTSGYEVHIGRRQEGRNQKGELSATVTRTFYISAEKLWKLLESAEGQAAWLKPLSRFKFKPKNVFETEDGFFGEIRTMREGERLRMSWQDPEWHKPTIVQIYVMGRDENKSMLAFMHDGIKDTRSKAAIRDRWNEAVEALSAMTPTAPVRRKKS
ncbi:SRPBCC domain-containing protein [Bdellovibrio bacteriovorus]|uniref:Activator of Hsp90 ATPase homologue 1/2-like C-terminal domain-containing protein n=1 Tax=Bdellovibrio bacteriovorus (strain ATCC 15356 / DSM 50701 / NCIMB 9529 / HD100) TaxID=264462 RepID=Q6MHB5_BDEBA|nr:SRPBCC domain-containing protein [Bdellovibrio bacteriovorus]AHZ83978.1 hypothetical protein EP01_03330 [Bdellovibrio bacteriovorus]BEV69957.1 hypothetical protein Bb109J_c3377 [Bdellovibrio bacteriovorus]CAE81012.1 hypothetical protein Bd3635 [Bdellovibrio bacteriovorus HD100]